MRPPDRTAQPDTAIGIGHAHGKVILLGEHAVVYGAPGLAVPLTEVSVTARIAALPGSAAVSFTALPEGAVGGLRDLVAQFKADAGLPDSPGLQVRLDSTIPPARGLGASAATARAVALALADLVDRDLDAQTVFDLVQTAETAAHGRSSGIDAIATGAHAPIRYVAGVAEQLRSGFDAVFVVADSGVSGRTKDAINHVRRVFDADPQTKADFLQRVSQLAETGVAALIDGQADAFGAKLTANHQLLRGIGLSTEAIDTLVAAALGAGARGAKISGGGLGGCMVALADDPAQAATVAAALRAAGAVTTWCAPVGRHADGRG